VVDAGAVPYLVPMIQHADAKLKRHVCACLAHIAKHTVDLAEVVVEQEVVPKIFVCLRDADATVRKNTATAIREIVKHTPELAQAVVTNAGHEHLIDYINETKGPARLPAIMAIGYIAAFSETLALAVIAREGVTPLKKSLEDEKEDYIKAAAAWSLGQVGRHTPDHAKALALADCFRPLIRTYAKTDNADLKKKCAAALKFVLSKCTHYPALEPLLNDAPEKILRYVVAQFAKILPNTPAARTSFVKNQCLRRIQELKTDDRSPLHEAIASINACFPPDVVQYYSPNYSEQLIKKIEEQEQHPPGRG